MIDIKILKKVKNTTNTPMVKATGSSYGELAVKEASHAAKADIAELAKEATHALLASQANTASHAKEAETLMDDSPVYDKVLRKDIEDKAQKLIMFLEGLAVGEDGSYYIDNDGIAQLSQLLVGDYTKDTSGAAIYSDNQGHWHIEGDYFHVRRKLTAEEVEIMHTSHIKGKIVNSPGGFTITKVEKVDGGWRCYFKNEDDQGRKVYNSMMIDDLALCETFNLIDDKGEVANHYWHRRVIAVGDNYVDIADNTNVDDYASGSNIPKEGDEVVTLGNRNNKDRQSAIIQSSAGSGAPYLYIIKEIDSFTLPKPIFRFDSEGFDIQIADPNDKNRYIRLEEYLSSLKGNIDAVRSQTDKQLILWFGDTIPTREGEPSGQWSTQEECQSHLHDIYYNRSAAKTGGGRAYSFEEDEAGGYNWVEITDADVLKSLEAANKAQDTADGKRRVFVELPEPPYDLGDQWTNAVYGDYQNDLLVCKRAKENGERFDISDWKPAQSLTTKSFEAKLQIGGKNITAYVRDLKDSLHAVGFDIDGEKKSFTIKADTTRFEDGEGKTAALIENGKLNAKLIDALKIVTEALKAGELDAENAIIKNLRVKGESTFEGTLSGVTGTFKKLRCVNEKGQEVASLAFGSEGNLWIDGDLFIQGSKDNRSLRFYSSDIWCRGSFNHWGRSVAVIKDDMMYLYAQGINDPTRFRLKKTENENYYKIPLYNFAINSSNLFPVATQMDKEHASGMSIDMVVFNCTKEHRYTFCNMGYGKTWTVLNGNDNQVVRIGDIGGWRLLRGGECADYYYVNPAWLSKGTSSYNKAAEGIFYSGVQDLNW